MNKYRYNDYYQMTDTFDQLYELSKQNTQFNDLMSIITSEQNLKLAFRMIKANTGSKTAGTDGITIDNLKEKQIQSYINESIDRLKMYKPDKVRRVYIPKAGSEGTRPLGIPTMRDRLIQQAIRQVLEPIVEAKFHKHSYGFRPNRSTKHAVARVNHLINKAGLYYVVDVDIKGFFDNVNHNKLIKQMYSMGITDMRLLAIIRTMLKAEIEGEGIPTKGTPQGGIISPLLSNIVLNELDWWLSNQWETKRTQKEYSCYNARLLAIKKTKLKEFYFVRYEDDFKILCRNYDTARRVFIAVQKWLKERLHLEISEEKSKIVNLKKNYTNFLGFKIKAQKKGKTSKGYVSISHIGDKAKTRIVKSLKEQAKVVQKHPKRIEVNKLNSIILGVHQYYKTATHVNLDFSEIAFSVNRVFHNRFKDCGKYEKLRNELVSKTFQMWYGQTTAKIWIVNDILLFPIHYIRHKSVMNFSQDICDYTKEGRNLATKRLKTDTSGLVQELAKRYNPKESIEYNDNRVSRASMCKFQCEITKTQLDLENLHCHHKKPKYLGGTDDYDNLIIIHKEVHKLIHAISEKTINKYLKWITDKKILNKINTLRKLSELEPIKI